MHLFETNSYYICVSGTKALYCDRISGKFSFKDASQVYKEWNPLCVGKIDGIVGKVRYHSDDSWRLLVISGSCFVGYLPDGLEVRRITRVSMFDLSLEPVLDSDLDPCELPHSVINKKQSSVPETGNPQKPRQNPNRRKAGTSPGGGPKHGGFIQREKYERRIHEEFVRLFQQEDGSFFYFSPGGGDLTNWTQRKHDPTYWTGQSQVQLSNVSESVHPKIRWHQPVWRRADQRFFWNSHLLSEAIVDAERLVCAHNDIGDQNTDPDVTTTTGEQLITDLECLIVPIVQGYVEVHHIPLTTVSNNEHLSESAPQDAVKRPEDKFDITALGETVSLLNQSDFPVEGHSVDQLSQSESSTFEVTGGEEISLIGLSETHSESKHHLPSICSNASSNDSKQPESNTSPDAATVVLFSRRSRYRAGTRFRRRGIDSDGHVANYVETEQILQVNTMGVPHTFAFLQCRGSVPIFWSQTGPKYRPPINLEKNFDENQEALDKHWNEMLSEFQHLVVVNLLDAGPKRSEKLLSEEFIRHLLRYNHANTTCMLFDFHDFCRGLHFENAFVLLSESMRLLQEAKFTWITDSQMVCQQSWIFRSNCLDCLDRTNLVQCLLANAVLTTQLKKIGLIQPEEERLPSNILRIMQRMWANNGDALSRLYAGTVAMKGDYTRTGERTMNGLVRDGVSSMSRYYLRLREIIRQASLDLLLGEETSPELLLVRSGAGTESALNQSREDSIKLIISRCRKFLLEEEQISLSECLLISYSELSWEPQFTNTILLVSNHHLHFLRIDLPTRRPVYVRIPTNAVEKMELGLEPSVLPARRYVLRIFYTPPQDTEITTVSLDKSPPQVVEKSSLGPDDKINDETKEMQTDTDTNDHQPVGADPEVNVPNIVDDDISDKLHQTASEVPSDKRERPPANPQRPNNTSRYYVAYIQPNMRLFNTILVPVAAGDETYHALQVTASMICVAVRSTGNEIDLNELPAKRKLRRIRQATIPLAYRPSVDLKSIFEGTVYSAERLQNRHRNSNQNREAGRKNSKPSLSEFDKTVLSGEETTQMNKIRQKLTQIKFPNLRIQSREHRKVDQTPEKTSSKINPPSRLFDRFQRLVDRSGDQTDGPIPSISVSEAQPEYTIHADCIGLTESDGSISMCEEGTTSDTDNEITLAVAIAHNSEDVISSLSDIESNRYESIFDDRGDSGAVPDTSYRQNGDDDDEEEEEDDDDEEEEEELEGKRKEINDSGMDELAFGIFRLCNQLDKADKTIEPTDQLDLVDGTKEELDEFIAQPAVPISGCDSVYPKNISPIVPRRRCFSENNLMHPTSTLHKRVFTSIQSVNSIFVRRKTDLIDQTVSVLSPIFFLSKLKSEFSLIDVNSLPPINISNQKIAEKLRKSQWDHLIRLDELRREICPNCTILTSFVVF